MSFSTVMESLKASFPKFENRFSYALASPEEKEGFQKDLGKFQVQVEAFEKTTGAGDFQQKAPAYLDASLFADLNSDIGKFTRMIANYKSGAAPRYISIADVGREVRDFTRSLASMNMNLTWAIDNEARKKSRAATPASPR